jgi:cation transport ATPase
MDHKLPISTWLVFFWNGLRRAAGQDAFEAPCAQSGTLFAIISKGKHHFMVTIAGMLVAGGVFWSGTVAYRQLRPVKRWFRRSARPRAASPISPIPEQAAGETPRALRRANQSLAISSISLGVTTAGLLFKPVLVLVSVPIGFFVFAPTLRAAWHTLRQERRITTPVLDATRFAICVAMGYYFALALDTWLRTFTQKVLAHTDDHFSHALDKHFLEGTDVVWLATDGADVETKIADLIVDDVISIIAGDLVPVRGTVLHGEAWVEEQLATGRTAYTRKVAGDPIFADTTVVTGQLQVQVTAIPEQPATDAIRQGLRRTVESGTFLQELGEASGRKMAPRIMAFSAIMLPFWTGNRAAGFLTTGFGSQMSTLSPYTLQNFINLAAARNLLIFDGHALEYLNLVNTIILDARILADAELRRQAPSIIRALRSRRWRLSETASQPFAVYLIADEDAAAVRQLAAEVGADDYFVEPLSLGRAALVERLTMGGRLTCYIGDGDEDARVMEAAQVSVALPAATGGSLTAAVKNGAQVVVMEKDLHRVEQLFDIARQFTAKQGFNLAWPLLMDLLDIGTTVFLHFGLTYSILFSYSGLLVSATNARIPLLRNQSAHESVQGARLLPMLKRASAP